VSVYLHKPSLMDYYSFNRPQRDGWLSWPCWLTDRGCFTHKVVTWPAVGLAPDKESSPAGTGGLTTMLCHQLLKWCIIVKVCLNVVERSVPLRANCTSALYYFSKARPQYLVPHCSVIESFLSTKCTVCRFTDCLQYFSRVD